MRINKYRLVSFVLFLIILASGLGAVLAYFYGIGPGSEIDGYIYDMIDIDNDGDLDILSTSGTLYINQGNEFVKDEGFPNFDIESSLFIDLDNDGNVDPLLMDPDTGVLSLFMNDGGLDFKIIQGWSNEEAYYITGILDIDGGYPYEMFFMNGSHISIQKTGMDGSYSEIMHFNDSYMIYQGSLEDEGQNVITVIGYDNISYIHGLWPELSYHIVPFNGTFLGYFDPNEHQFIDLNSDGTLDLLESSRYGDRVIFLGDDPEAVDPDTILYELGFDYYYGDSLVGDLDLDGHFDLVFFEDVYMTGSEEPVHVFFNDGYGNFTDSVDIKIGELLDRNLVDIDQDGDLDIIATEYMGDNVVYIENLGSRKFKTHLIDVSGFHFLSESVDPFTANALDIDQDGDLDIITDNYNGGSVSVLTNDGSGNFDLDKEYMVTYSFLDDIEVVDVDGDGDEDVVTISRYGSYAEHYYRVNVLENDGSGDLTTPLHYLTPSLLMIFAVSIIVFIIWLIVSVIRERRRNKKEELLPIPHIDPEMVDKGIRLEYNIDESDIAGFNQDHISFKKERPTIRESISSGIGASGLVITIVFLSWLFFIDDGIIHPFLFFGIFLVLVLGILITFFPDKLLKPLVKALVKRNLKKGINKTQIGKHRLIIDPEGVHNRTPISDVTLKWPAIESIKEGNDHIYLYISKRSAFIIRKDAMGSETRIKEFKDLASYYMLSTRKIDP